MNRQILKALGMTKELALVDNDRCPFCKKVIDFDSFRDEQSRKEFKISGLCQGCQDQYFGS